MGTDNSTESQLGYVEGAISVLAVLRAGSRPVYQLLLSQSCDRENRNVQALLRIAQEQQLPVRTCSDQELLLLVNGNTHGGVVAQVGQRKLCSLEELLSRKDGFFCLLTGIEDPYNFGDALRSLYAFGVDGVVLGQRNWLSAASVTARSSAGASELVDCAVYTDEDELVEICKKYKVKIVCAEEKDSQSLHRCDLSRPLLLVIGGEKRGIQSSLLEKADLRIRIPYGRNFNRSLSASAAAAAIGFEITRQQRGKNFRSSHGKGKKKS